MNMFEKLATHRRSSRTRRAANSPSTSLASCSSSADIGFSVIPRISLKISATAGAVTSMRTAVATWNGPALRRKVNCELRAVGVAVLLAQVHVDAAREQAAERHVHHLHRAEVGRRARGANRGHPHLRLRRTGLVHDDDARGRRRRRGERRCAGVPRGQAPNAFSASACSSAIEMSPATTSAALFGTKFCFQNAACRRASCLDRRLGADLGEAVRMTVAVQRTPRSPAPRPAEALSRCCTSCASRLRALPLDLGGREGRPQHDVGHQVQRRREVLREQRAR